MIKIQSNNIPFSLKTFSLVIAFIFSVLHSQTNLQSGSIDSLFSSGTSLYIQDKYKQAFDKFQMILQNQGSSYKKEESALFSAKIYLTLKQYPAAEQELKTFPVSYPGSAYLDEARFTLAEVLWKQKKKTECVTLLLNSVATVKNDSVKK